MVNHQIFEKIDAIWEKQTRFLKRIDLNEKLQEKKCEIVALKKSTYDKAPLMQKKYLEKQILTLEEAIITLNTYTF